jgi:hypothetical protein
MFLTLKSGTLFGSGRRCEGTHSRAPQGEVDGLKIDLFHVRITYDLSTPLASLLVCEGYAEPVYEFMGDRRRKVTAPFTRAVDRRRTS